MTRVLATAALAVLVASAGCDSPGGVAERLEALEKPNLVLVLVDTLRPDWTTPYGFARDTSPELQRWADHGVVFEHTLAQSSWTKISMVSLLASLWPRRHRITEFSDRLAPSARTLAELLHEAGYATWALQTNGWLHPAFGFRQGFDVYEFLGTERRISLSPGAAHAGHITKRALEFVAAREPDRPFFLYVHYMDVHDSVAPPELERFGEGPRAEYLASIRWVDGALRRLRRGLEEAGVLDRTVLVLASDHGQAFGEHGLSGHGYHVLESILEVPLVMRLPFPAEPIRVETQVRNVDIAPTLLDLAGVPAPGEFDGRSLLPLIEGDRESDRPSYAGLGAPTVPGARRQVSVDDGRWTFARNLGPQAPVRELLFDRLTDPAEEDNRVASDPARAEQMRARLDAYLEREPAGVRQTAGSLSDAHRARLRAMGYAP